MLAWMTNTLVTGISSQTNAQRSALARHLRREAAAKRRPKADVRPRKPSDRPQESLRALSDRRRTRPALSCRLPAKPGRGCRRFRSVRPSPAV